MAPGTLEQQPQPLGVDLAHAPEVAREVPGGDEVAQHRLLQQLAGDGGDRAGGRAAVHQVRRDDQVAEPQRGEEDLAEAAGEEHLRAAVEPLQGGNGPARVAKLAVVVVLEDRARRTSGPSPAA